MCVWKHTCKRLYGAFKPLFALSGNFVAYWHLCGFGVSYFDRFKNPKTLKNVMYNYSIMSVSDWAGLVLTALSIIAITVGGIRWYITAEIKVLSTELKNDLSELKPNGGSSMKDQVNRLEEKSHRLEEKIDNLYNVLINEGVRTNKTKKSENTEL
jgi:hypothetical protein